jgi:hypothetical protein
VHYSSYHLPHIDWLLRTFVFRVVEELVHTAQIPNARVIVVLGALGEFRLAQSEV